MTEYGSKPDMEENKTYAVVSHSGHSGSWYQSSDAGGACSLQSDKVKSIKAGWNYRKFCQNKSGVLAAGDKAPLGIVVRFDR